MNIREIMLVIHFIGLAMGVGTSIAFLFLGIAASKMGKEEAMKFQGNAFILTRMGHIGITLLILSGAYMMTPFWGDLGNRPELVTKLILVAILVVLIIVLTTTGKKVINTGNPELMKRMRVLGPIALLVSLSIIVMATISFH